jgi:hypothetical protein
MSELHAVARSTGSPSTPTAAPLVATRIAPVHVAVLAITLFASPIPSLVMPDRNYTWSLLNFIVPGALILGWFLLTPGEELRPIRKAIWATLGLLVPLGAILNLFFAADFFLYPNPQAVCGWMLPSLGFFRVDWTHPIPIEELVFYVTGFAAMLLVYLWGNEFFVRRYSVRDHAAEVAHRPALVRLAIGPVIAAVAIVGAGWAYKRFIAGEDGFPGYLAYLILIPFVVTFTLLEVARPFINWQAFTLMLLYILGISVLWEVSLALPGGWWDYQPSRMIGIRIGRWNQLPLEAVLVWFLAAFATVVVFEAMKVFFAHPERPQRHVSLVVDDPPAPERLERGQASPRRIGAADGR